MKTELQKLCDEKRITIESHYGAVEVPEGWPRGTHPYKCILRFGRKRMTVPFFMGPANEHEPEAADVLSCLILDSSACDASFEEWCSDMGYGSYSRSAEKTYKACLKAGKKVRAFLGDEFDTFAQAEH